MSLTVLSEEQEIKAAFQALSSVVKSGTKTYSRRAGFQGGGGKWRRKRKVHWNGKYGFWAIIEPTVLESRFWCSFGTQDPATHKSLQITCEANSPKAGVDRGCGGVFLRNGGSVYLGHTGRVAGGREGVGKNAFVAWYAERFKITRPDGIIIIGKLSSPRFLPNLAKFIFAVEEFKEEVTSKENVDEQLERDANDADEQGEFNPKSIKESRETAIRSINVRRGRPEFRKKLLKAYGHRCAFCNCDCPDALEAAHIQGYGGEETNHVQNGLLLRSDLHTLFDLGKIAVDPKDFRIVVSNQLMTTVYRRLNGKKLRLPANPSQWPNEDVLGKHLKQSRLK